MCQSIDKAERIGNVHEYDENGNLTKDLNKNKTAIQYNCLNLPSRVMFATVSYTHLDVYKRQLWKETVL